MVFVDSNIPMYIVGVNHPNKDRCIKLLETLTRSQEIFVTNAEVYQEIIHRYSSLGQHRGIETCFSALNSFIDHVFPIDRADVLEAHRILLAYKGLSSRDALHVSIIRKYNVNTIFSFDTGFEQIKDIKRVP